MFGVRQQLFNLVFVAKSRRTMGILKSPPANGTVCLQQLGCCLCLVGSKELFSSSMDE